MNTDDSLFVLGSMSGTSMDGVDAAVLRTDGRSILEFGQSGYRAYSAEERKTLRMAMGRWPGDPGIDDAAVVVENAHAELLSEFDAELIGFHGQTLAHDPRVRGTHQVGNGAMLAVRLGKSVVWDFRSADVRNGGQGAPLAPFFHFACARWARLKKPVVFVNLGGVGNLTWLDPRISAPEEVGACLAFDTGPANAPIDDLVRARSGLNYDRNGALARAGRTNDVVVERFLQADYFNALPPKSLDRDAFPELCGLIAELSDIDAAATLVSIAAACVARGMSHCPILPDRVFVSGGGRKNPALMGELTRFLDCPVQTVEAIGLDGDMLEAQAFAFLAARVVRGLVTTCPATTGVDSAICGGEVALP